jgi:hypothetical protein
LKNLVLAGRGDDCIASYIDGRCVMQDGQVHGVDYPTLQRQAQHNSKTDAQPQRPGLWPTDWKTLFQPAILFADNYSAQAPLSAIDPLL